MSSIRRNHSCMGSSKIGYIFLNSLCNLRVSITYFQLFMHIQHDLGTNKKCLRYFEAIAAWVQVK